MDPTVPYMLFFVMPPHDEYTVFNFNALSRSALDSPEQNPEDSLLGISRAVANLELLDDKKSENRQLGIVLGGLTANYALVRTVIRLPPDSTYEYVF